jgi:hypothetical protein
VKKYLRSEETEPAYTGRVSPSKLDPYAEKLATWLGIEATKSRKQRRNLKQIYTPHTQYPILGDTSRVWELLDSDNSLGGFLVYLSKSVSVVAYEMAG